MQIDQHNFHSLLHSANLIEAELRKQLSPLGLLPRQARIIEAIGRMGSVSQTALADEFGITPASMSTMTDRLLAAGYIARNVDPSSRRQNSLTLTKKGQALLTGIEQAWAATDDAIRHALGPDADALFGLTRKLRDTLGGKVPGG